MASSSADIEEFDPSEIQESTLLVPAESIEILQGDGPTTESIEISPTISEEQPSNDTFIQLGDEVMIESSRYGRTHGIVYFRSEDEIHVKPHGVSNDVHRFEIEPADDESADESFDEELGVTAVYILRKRTFESFIEQNDIRVNDTIYTFDQDRQPYKTYRVVGVDVDKDAITIQEPNEENNDEIVFNFVGIPSEWHLEFVTMRVRPRIYSDKPEEEEEVKEEEEIQEVVEEEEPEVTDEIDIGIEEVGVIEIVISKVFTEAASYEQRIPDDIQRLDAMNDFISSLDPSLQHDPYAIRSIRIFVETLFHLKQTTIQYEKSGHISGAKTLSASTLAELIDMVSIPLGRPVLRVSKKVYITNDSDELEARPLSDHIKFLNFLWELKQMNDDTITRDWQKQRSTLETFYSPWSRIGTDEPLWKAITDSDFFRMNPPDSMDQLTQPTLPGYVASHDIKAPPTFYKVPFGIERALSTTYRKGVDRRKEVLVEEEKATMNSYLLFPFKTVNMMGATRTRQLAIDSGRSQLPPKTMKMILRECGDPTEMGATSNHIVLLNTLGNTLGNIPLVDYIKGMNIPSLGIGDTYTALEQYGIDNMELNEELVKMLSDKIQSHQAQLITSLAELRKKIQASPPKEPESNPFLDNPAFFEEIQRQPMLANVLHEFEEQHPNLAHSDLGKVIHLMKIHPTYFQIAAGKNPLQVGKAFLDANRSIYLSQLMIDQQMNHIQTHSGIRPRKNPCRHVSDLVSVRKLRDDSERFYELTKIFRIYQGARDQNWINCNTCQEHFLCCHERLQLQAYLNPKEKDTIEKEIILMFSGGQFQGKYICRNCGQTMRDLDFDNNLEFDDNGKPKSGRAVLMDEDAIMDKQIQTAVNLSIEPTMKEEMKLDQVETTIYDIVREIAERVGIQLDQIGYRNIIRNTKLWINTFPDADSYAKRQVKAKARGQSIPDYKIASTRNTINACAVYLLVEIQTKIPAYVVRYALKGCKNPGFDGYPLDPNIENKQGIEYIACGIASIRNKDGVWDVAYRSVSDVDRQKGIAIGMDKIIERIIDSDVIQAQMDEKRRYLTHVLGVSTIDGDRSRDAIPSTFLPEQLVLTREEAAAQVISKEVVEHVRNSSTRATLVKLWIRQAHAIARQNAVLIQGTAFSETTCCMNKVNEPGSFWKSIGDLPTIHHRSLYPHTQGQMLLTNFIPRAAEKGVTEPNKDLYYRLFLKCCFQGPRIGYSHQPGVTNQCLWCGFQFPGHPKVIDTDKEGKAALSSIKTDTPEFTELLDTIHKVNHVQPVKLRTISTVEQCMDDIISIKPMPFPQWDVVMKGTVNRFLALNHPAATADDFAVAAGELFQVADESKQEVTRRLRYAKFNTLLEQISELSWVDFSNVLQIYFIIPFQRILSNFSPESLAIPIELSVELSDLHVTDLQPILKSEVAFLAANKAEISGTKIQFAKAKLRYYLSQMSSILSVTRRIRPSVIPGREHALKYIQQAFLYGPLFTLVDSSHIPDDAVYQSAMTAMFDLSIEFLLKMIASSLNKYENEYLSYNEQQIKDMIATKEEKERVYVVSEFDRLGDDERRVEWMNKKLGIGKWAVGGTKVIYAYDKAYYDLERRNREKAGMNDIPGGEEIEQPQYNEFGLDDPYDDGMEENDGYDHNQHADDDRE
jgi:hypothetical protein